MPTTLSRDIAITATVMVSSALACAPSGKAMGMLDRVAAEDGSCYCALGEHWGDCRHEWEGIVESGRISAEAIDRKLRSEKILRAEGVPVLATLPVIETAAEALKRSKEEVALRTLCVLFVAAKGEGLGEELAERLLDSYELRPHLTCDELAFVLDTSPSEHDRIQFTWKHEAAWTLLWALGFVAELGKPAQICDVGFAASTMAERTTSQFIEDSELRPIADILDQADLIYRYHWAVRNARIKRQQVPAGLDPGVTQERHHALNWLIGYDGREWDDITTDT